MKRFLGKHLLFLALLASLSSCTEEEFFEKDFLQDNQQQEDNGGTDGSNDTSNDGTNDGGNDGDTTGDDGSNSNLQTKVESFTQQAGNNKVDILWVVDNSGSMGGEQAALGNNFDAFIQDFITKDVDFKMAITTTDQNGAPVAGSLESLSRQNLIDDQAQFIQDFKDMIKVGTNGSGTERGLHSAEKFTLDYAPNNFRDDAYYTIVYVSDEKDHSVKTPNEYLQNLIDYKGEVQRVKAYSIVNMNPGYSGGFARYEYVSVETQGIVSDINQDFYQILSDIGDGIASLAFSFVLAETVADVTTIEVKIDGQVVTTGWSYSAQNNAIEFTEASAPAAGSDISVTYQW